MPFYRWMFGLGVFLHNSAYADAPAAWGLPQEAAVRTVPGLSVSAQRLLYSGTVASSGTHDSSGELRPPVPAGAAYIQGSSIAPDYSKSATEFENKLNNERSRYISTQRNVEDVQGVLRAGSLVAGPISVASAWTGIGAVGGALTTTGLVIADTMVYYYGKAASEEYKAKVSTLYAHAWNELSNSDPEASNAAQADLASGDRLRQAAALKTLLGRKASIFEGTGVVAVSPEELQASQPFFVEALKEGLANMHSVHERDLVAVRAEVAKANQAMNHFKEDIGGRIGRVKASLDDSKKAIDLLEGRVSSLDSSVKMTNTILFYKLSPKEQKEALTQGFDIGLDESKKKAVIAQLEIEVAQQERTNAIQKIQATAKEAYGIAGSVISLARNVGVSIPPEVDRAMDVGFQAFSVASAFALGPAGGVMALAGAFGALKGGSASGPDPVIMNSFARIDEKLGEIIALQKETIDRLIKLDAKLSAQHREVMAAFVRLEGKVDKLIDVAFDTQASKLQSCDDFALRLSNAVSRQPHRASYDVIQETFNSTPIVRHDYLDCMWALADTTRIVDSRVHWYLRNRPVQDTDVGKNVRSPTHTMFYRPAYEFTMRELDLNNDDQCARRMLAKWMQKPETFASYDPASNSCDALNKAGAPEFKHYLENTAKLKAQVLLADYLNYDAYIYGTQEQLLPTLVRYQIEIAPFYEIVGAASFLPDISAIKPTPPGVIPPALDALAGILDIIGIAEVQEVIMSGAPTAHRIVAYLNKFIKEKSFGFNPDGAGGPPPPLTAQTPVGSESDLFWEHCDIGRTQEVKAAHVVCLLERHPEILANSLAYWVHSALENPATAGATPTRNLTYHTAFTLQQLPFMQRVLPDFDWHDDAEGVYGFVLRKPGNDYRPADLAKDAKSPEPGWYFKMNRLDKSTWYTPLPGAFEVKTQPIRYRAAAQMLAHNRNLALQEYDRFSAIKSIDVLPTETQRFLSVIALQESQMAARTFNQPSK